MTKDTTSDSGGGAAAAAVTHAGPERDQWSSRIAFYFTAVGAAVGFGNVWRFPALSVEYGGGAFFIPYLMALFFVGLPILILEVAFGQFFQTGDINVFGGFHPRMRGIGVASIACGFMLVAYYSALIAWVIDAFFDSFGSNDPWAGGTDGEAAVNYFINKVIGADTTTDEGRPTRVIGDNVGYSFMTWAIMFLGTAFGAKWTGRLTYVTMGIPVILLFVFLGKAVTLEGSSDGIVEYIGRWDLSVLSERGDVWSTAVSQIFFSLGVTFGIMTALSSYCPSGEPVVLNSCVVAAANSTFSFISGFAVFAALGHLAYLNDTSVLDIPFGGFSLVFGTWPVVLGTLPGGEHWVRLLFFDLFLLGIDSAFGFVEAISTVISDTKLFHRVTKWKINLALCVVGFLLSILYATDAGLNFLDVVDYYINFVMILIGFFECFAAGWVYDFESTIETCGRNAFAAYMTANFASVFIACGVWFGARSVWGGFLALFGFYFIGIGITYAFLLQKQKSMSNPPTTSTMFRALAFRNIYRLRDRIKPVVRHIPDIWCILIKQFIPHILLILFINLAQSETDKGVPVFGNYGGYEDAPFQIIGIICFAFALFCCVLGLVFPQAYNCLTLPDGHASLDPDPVVVDAEPVVVKDEKLANGNSDESDSEGNPVTYEA